MFIRTVKTMYLAVFQFSNGELLKHVKSIVHF